VGLLPRAGAAGAARFRTGFGWPQLLPPAPARLAFLALARLAFLALARLGLAPREVRPQRRREPLLVPFGSPVGHCSDLGEAERRGKPDRRGYASETDGSLPACSRVRGRVRRMRHQAREPSFFEEQPHTK
jgi:hypothetical protein